jgi:hypothetical protein
MTTEVNNAPAEENKPEVIVPLQLGEATPEPPIEPKESPEGAVFEYDSTGDVGLDMALQFVGKVGLGPEDPAMIAAAQGDFSILRAKLASKGVQGWEQYVALGEAAFKKTQEAAKEKTSKLQALVHSEAGGAEVWAEVQKWASANASPEEKAEINAMLNAGGLQAKQAVRYLTAQYEKAGNVIETPADPTANASRANGPAADGKGPLSAAQYVEAVRELNIKLRGRIDGHPEYEALQRRRAAGMR